MTNIVKNYFRVLEVISSLNCKLEYKSDVGRKQKMSDCVLLGDRGYLFQSIQLDLFQTVNIKLETPKRANQKDYKPQPYIFRKSRKKLKHYFHNYATNSELETIMLKLLKVLKQEF